MACSGPQWTILPNSCGRKKRAAVNSMKKHRVYSSLLLFMGLPQRGLPRVGIGIYGIMSPRELHHKSPFVAETGRKDPGSRWNPNLWYNKNSIFII